MALESLTGALPTRHSASHDSTVPHSAATVCPEEEEAGMVNATSSNLPGSDTHCSPSHSEESGYHSSATMKTLHATSSSTAVSTSCFLSGSAEDNKTNLIVNYLPQNMSQEEIRALFASIGEVESCKLIRDKTTGQSLGYGFVNYVHAEHAEKALNSLNGLRLQNKVIKISLARPSSETIKGANLYVCGLPKAMGQAEMERMFAPCGKIITSRILYDTNTGLSKCVGFIRFDQKHEADLAIKRLHGHIPPGCTEPITVKFANSPTNLSTKGHLSSSTSSHNTNATDPICLLPSAVYQVHSTSGNERSVLGPVHHLPISRYRFNPLESSSSSRRMASLLPSASPISNGGLLLVGSTAAADNAAAYHVPSALTAMSTTAPMTAAQHQALLMTALETPSVNPRVPSVVPHGLAIDPSTSTSDAAMLNLLTSGYPALAATTSMQPQIGIEFLSTGPSLFPTELNIRHHQQQQQLLASALSVQLNALQSHALSNVSTAPLLGVALTNGGLVNPVNVATHPNLLAAAAAQANYMNGGNLLGPTSTALVTPQSPNAVASSNTATMSPNNQQWTLFVNNLPSDADESLLWHLFSSFGTVQSHKIIRDPTNQKCKGFAFVTMASYGEAVLAMQHLNGASVGNRVLQVAFKTAGRNAKMDSTLLGMASPLQHWKT